MPSGRCRSYDEQGTPINGGCRREGCRYLHPSEPGWNTALPPRPNNYNGGGGGFGTGSNSFVGTDGGYAGRGRGRGGGPPSRGGSFRSNFSDNAGGNNDSWAKSWGETPAASRGGSASSTADSGSGWGWSEGGGGWGSVTVDEGDRNAMRDKGTGSGGGGWGNVTVGEEDRSMKKGKNTEDRSSSGWGSSTWGGGENKPVGVEKISSGWGDSTWGSGGNKPEDEKSTSTGTWGNTNWDGGGGGWGDSKSNQEKPKTDEKKHSESSWNKSDSRNTWDDASRKDSTSTNDSWQTGATWKDSIPTGPRLRTDSNVTVRPTHQRVDTSNIQDRRVSEQLPPTPTASESLYSKDEDISMDWSRVTDSKPVDSRPRAFSPTGTEATASTKRKIPDEKRDEWGLTLKTFAEGIHSLLEVRKAGKERDQFRRAQNSSSYQRIGKAGEKKLNGTREELEKKLHKARKSYSDSLARLMELPSSSSPLDLEANIQEMKHYAAELKEWIEETRPILINATSPLPPPPPSSIDKDDSPRPLKRPRLSLTPELDEAALQFQEIIRRIELLEEKAFDPQNEDYSSTLAKYTTVMDTVDEKMKDLVDKPSSLEEGEYEATPPPNKFTELHIKLDGLGAKLELQAGLVAGALSESVLQNKEQEYDQLKAESERLKAKNLELDRRITDLEESDRSDAIRLEGLSTLLRDLIASTHNPPPLAFKYEDVKEQLNPIVQNTITTCIHPVLDQLQSRFESQIKVHHQEIYTRVWHNLYPCVKVVDGMHRWMEEEALREKNNS